MAPPRADPASTSAASEVTYASKLPADHPGLRLDRPRGRALRRGPVLAAAGALTGVVLVATFAAFSPRSDEVRAEAAKLAEEPRTSGVTAPDEIQHAAPGQPARRTEPPRLGPPLHGAEPASPETTLHAAGPAEPLDSLPRASARESLREEREKASLAPILADLDGPARDGPGQAPLASPGALLGGASPDVATSDQAPAAPLVGPAGTGDANMQQHKSDFLAREGVETASYLNEPVVAPRSPYEIKAGTIIPASLLTAIDSDLPGQIIGQVRENVYDTVSGNHLLIPQGSRLLASYDAVVSYGHERVLFCWNRLVRPDGLSISLACAPGADLGGASGAADEVDHHGWRIVTGIALGTLLAATAERVAGNVTGYQPTVAQNWAANAGAAVNQAGQQLTQKNLAIQPTITVRAGYSVNVIVTKDIVFPPYPRSASP